MVSSPPSSVQHISKCTVKPAAGASTREVELSVWDVPMLSAHYIQKGLLFASPLPPTNQIIQTLTSSLSKSLLHFPPLSGRLVSSVTPRGTTRVSVQCDDSGAEFIHATSTLSVAQFLSQNVDDFFPYNHAVNHDGHSIPLLALQFTELTDGAFLAFFFNHVVGDGTSFWHFLNSWAEIARGGELSRPPVLDRCFVGCELPFTSPSEFIARFASPPLRERKFHFSSHSLTELKAKANRESSGNFTISTFQALSALVWRAITRARGLQSSQNTSCRLAVENRRRLQPPLSPDYFGNSLYAIAATATVEELLGNNLGYAAKLLNETVCSYGDAYIRGVVSKYYESPVVYGPSMLDPNGVMMGSSPRFDMYGCEFGFGKVVAIRSGPANKFDGKTSSYPGREGGGSIDLEVCLYPEYMAALEMDTEFMNVVSEV